MSQLIPFQFHDHNLRTQLSADGKPWWVAKDVCDILELGNVTRSISRLDEDEVTLMKLVDSLGKTQEMTLVNEPGLYNLILRSRKPMAKEFKRWVTHEVIPSLRTTGTYTLPLAHPKDAPSHLTDTELAQRDLEAWLIMSERLGAPLHIAQIEAVKAIAQTTGVDLKPLLLHAPAQRNIPDDVVMLEPTSLAKYFRYKTGHDMNLVLEQLGWQVRDDGGEWVPTAVGAPHAIRNSWTSKHSTKSGYNYRWNRAAVAAALKHARAMRPQDA